jgi:hypothetical protein
MRSRSTENMILTVFAICTILFALYPAWRMLFPLEIDRNEAWNAYHVDSVLNGLPLYPATGSLVINNYPPLSFYLIGAVSLLTSDVILTGRLVSLLSTLGISSCVFMCVSAFSGSYRGALLGALWFAAMIVRPFRHYAAMNDPQLLALFIMALGFVWFARTCSKGGSALGPLILMVVAGFFKHNLIAIPVTSLAWLWLTQGRASLKSTLAAAGVASLGLVLCVIVFGPAFIHNLCAPRSFSWAHLGYRLGTFQWVAPAIAICGVGLWLERSTFESRLIGLLLLTSTFAYLLQAPSDGVDENAIFEMLFALAIGIGVLFDRLPSHGFIRAPAIIMLALLSRLLLAPGIEFVMIVASSNYRQQYQIHSDTFRKEETRISTIGGDVACSVMSVCRGAGKPFVYDDFYVKTLLEVRAMRPADIDRIMDDRHILLEPVDPRTKAAGLEYRLSDLR